MDKWLDHKLNFLRYFSYPDRIKKKRMDSLVWPFKIRLDDCFSFTWSHSLKVCYVTHLRIVLLELRLSVQTYRPKKWTVLSHHTDCIAPLGMENKQISDAQISASSMSDDNSSPSKARLHLKEEQNLTGGGGWSAIKNDLHQWLQVDFGGYSTVTRVATQGRTGSIEWVTNYKLQYSDDGMNFQFYKEHGNKSAKVPSHTYMQNTLKATRCF